MHPNFIPKLNPDTGKMETPAEWYSRMQDECEGFDIGAFLHDCYYELAGIVGMSWANSLQELAAEDAEEF